MKWRLAPAADKSELNRNVIDHTSLMPQPVSLFQHHSNWSAGVVTLHLSPKTAALQAAAISYLPPADMLGHSDWIRTSIPRIRSQSLESDQVLLNGVKAINYFDKSALLNP